MERKISIKEQRFISLVLTENCNLACSYCYERHKSGRTMPIETAYRILDEELNADTPYKLVNISLFGGEPFLCFDAMKKIVDYAETHCFSKAFQFDITTNGTLVHGEIQDWLSDHKQSVLCALSLDGDKFSHDINRSNSFDDIDLDFFTRTYPIAPIKMTISEKTLPYLSENVIFCAKKGFRIYNNFAYGIPWDNAENIEILSRELNKLIEFYLENTQFTPCTMLNEQFHQIASNVDMPYVKSWCAAGFQSATYDCDGISYPCQFFMPLSAGSMKTDDKKLVFPEKIAKEDLLGACRTCPVVSACPTCYGNNFVNNGDMYRRDMNLCKLHKVMLKARAYFKGKLWSLGRLNLSEGDEYALLKSILIIQENL